jgi:hypothetical protein
MERNGGTNACERVDLAGIAEFLFNRACRRSLQKFPETRSRVGKTPRRDLDPKSIQSLEYSFSKL